MRGPTWGEWGARLAVSLVVACAAVERACPGTTRDERGASLWMDERSVGASSGTLTSVRAPDRAFEEGSATDRTPLRGAGSGGLPRTGDVGSSARAREDGSSSHGRGSRVLGAEARAARVEPSALEPAPDGVLAGQIVDERGVPRDLRLVLAPIGGTQFERLRGQRRLSDLELDRGRFRFEGVSPGRYELSVCDERHVLAPVAIESDGRGVAGIVLEVRVGTRVLVEFDGRGTVHVHDELGRIWHEREHDGTALFALLPGAYRVETRGDAGAEHALDLDVRDKPVRIDFRR
ncbi:MAG: hypothetical protein IPJ77_23665 [Planctomycetes bacterium]|nr:hypothetical protein [Planctomycetota bacterium]